MTMASMRQSLDRVRHDVHAAVRGVRRSPGFAAAIVLTLALGIGANAAMFGIIDRLMFRPFPYLRDPGSVHRVYWRAFERGTESIRWDGEYRRYLDFQDWTRSFSEVAAFARRTVAIGEGDGAREGAVGMVSASYFGFFDARPALGRFFTALPVVEHASSVMTVPLLETGATYLGVPGIDDVDRLGVFTYQSTTPDYFRVMRTRILRGRGIADHDGAGAPRVAVVSESMARLLWPGQNPIGQRMRVFADTLPWTTVVGIAEDLVQTGVSAPQRYHYYLSSAQFWPQSSGSRLLVRTRGDVAVAAEALRSALQSEMPGASYVSVRPFRELVHAERRSWRLGATLFVAFGLLALFVAAVGLYAVIGYEVAQRRRELGVRIALGARSPHLLRLVLWQGARFALAGTVLGCGVSLLSARWLQPLLFQESARDPAVYAAVVAVMVLVALCASAVPAGRALRADPNDAVRAE